MSSLPHWSVIATVAEPVELLVAFAAHHLAAGAQEVFLFLDDPRSGDAEALSSIPGVEVVSCDAAYWQDRLGQPRPDSLTRVQRINANHAYDLTRAEWLFHIDADEFLHADRPLAEVLAEVPEAVDYLRVQNCERAYRPREMDRTYTSLFRCPFNGRRWEERDLFGEAIKFSNKGFSAYTIGKGASRVGRDLQLTLHRANFRSARMGHPAPQEQFTDEIVLAHFDGVTPLNWMAKLLRYNEIGTYEQDPNKGRGRGQRKRAQQIDYVVQHRGDLGKLRALHDMLKVIEPGQEAVLTDLGLLVDLPIDPAAAVETICPWLRFDYSASNIDAALFTRASAARREVIKRLQRVA